MNRHQRRLMAKLQRKHKMPDESQIPPNGQVKSIENGLVIAWDKDKKAFTHVLLGEFPAEAMVGRIAVVQSQILDVIKQQMAMKMMEEQQKRVQLATGPLPNIR